MVLTASCIPTSSTCTIIIEVEYSNLINDLPAVVLALFLGSCCLQQSRALVRACLDCNAYIPLHHQTLSPHSCWGTLLHMYNIYGIAKMLARSGTSSALSVQQADQRVEHVCQCLVEDDVEHNLAPSVLVAYLEFLKLC